MLVFKMTRSTFQKKNLKRKSKKMILGLDDQGLCNKYSMYVLITTYGKIPHHF